MNAKKIRADFPVLTRKIHGKRLVYLDNAATTQKPTQVIDALTNYYTGYNSNVHRGIHTLSIEATNAYDEARKKISSFFNAQYDETIFTRGTTESINLLAYTLERLLPKGGDIAITQMEHHSNLVPWQQYAQRTGANLRIIKIDEEGRLDMNSAEETITDKTRILAFAHMSNVLGTINDVNALTKIASDHGAITILDAAQSATHIPINFKKTSADFLAASGHKMLGPTGIGILIGKRERLELLPPFHFGGEMIREVHYNKSIWNNPPYKFEAGTPNIAGAIGYGAATDYLNKISMSEIQEHGKKLTSYAIKKLEQTGATTYGPKDSDRGPVISFNLDGIHPHDAGSLLDDQGIAVRAGHHCAMPLMELLQVPATIRASFSIYNDKDDVDALIDGVEYVKKVFGGRL
ncbi:Cysteine desulfurase [uncultured archaeon]|nr:Cysteine desulfurase [uncultured archaeon]